MGSYLGPSSDGDAGTCYNTMAKTAKDHKTVPATSRCKAVLNIRRSKEWWEAILASAEVCDNVREGLSKCICRNEFMSGSLSAKQLVPWKAEVNCT